MQTSAMSPLKMSTLKLDLILRWDASPHVSVAKSSGHWTTGASMRASTKSSTPPTRRCHWRTSLSTVLRCSVTAPLLTKSSEVSLSKPTVRNNLVTLSFCWFPQYEEICHTSYACLFFPTAKPSRISCMLHYEYQTMEGSPNLFTCNWEHHMNSSLKISYNVLWVVSDFSFAWELL